MCEYRAGLLREKCRWNRRRSLHILIAVTSVDRCSLHDTFQLLLVNGVGGNNWNSGVIDVKLQMKKSHNEYRGCIVLKSGVSASMYIMCGLDMMLPGRKTIRQVPKCIGDARMCSKSSMTM